MGAKIKILSLVFFITNIIFAQNTIKELKRYALYNCIVHNYHLVDSLCDTHDYTSSHIFEVKQISNELMDEVRNFTIENTKDFYKEPLPALLYDEKANYVCYLCADFYESKKLHSFIKKLIDKYKRK